MARAKTLSNLPSRLALNSTSPPLARTKYMYSKSKQAKPTKLPKYLFCFLCWCQVLGFVFQIWSDWYRFAETNVRKRKRAAPAALLSSSHSQGLLNHSVYGTANDDDYIPPNASTCAHPRLPSGVVEVHFSFTLFLSPLLLPHSLSQPKHSLPSLSQKLFSVLSRLFSLQSHYVISSASL